jgi:hypothetical protein
MGSIHAPGGTQGSSSFENAKGVAVDDLTPTITLPRGAISRSQLESGKSKFKRLRRLRDRPNARAIMRRQQQERHEKLTQKTRCTFCSHAPFNNPSSLREHIAAIHTQTPELQNVNNLAASIVDPIIAAALPKFVVTPQDVQQTESHLHFGKVIWSDDQTNIMESRQQRMPQGWDLSLAPSSRDISLPPVASTAPNKTQAFRQLSSNVHGPPLTASRAPQALRLHDQEDVPFTDSAYASGDSHLHTRTAERPKLDSKSLKVVSQTGSEYKDQITNYSVAETADNTHGQSYVAILASNIYHRLSRDFDLAKGADESSFTEVFPALLKSFALQMGSQQPSQLRLDIMYFLHKHNR